MAKGAHFVIDNFVSILLYVRPESGDCTLGYIIATWTEQYRHIWEASFDRMDDYINQINQLNKQEKAKEQTNEHANE